MINFIYSRKWDKKLQDSQWQDGLQLASYIWQDLTDKEKKVKTKKKSKARLLNWEHFYTGVVHQFNETAIFIATPMKKHN